MATIKDVAQAAQVSAAAVSRVLNKDDNISVTPEVRARIFQAAHALGYVSPRQRKAAEHKTHLVIGVADWRIIRPDRPNVRLSSLSCLVQMMTDQYEVSFVRLTFGESQKVDGIIALGVFSKKEIDFLRSLSFAIVFVNSNQHNYEFDQVQVDFDRGQEKMVSYLLDQKRYTGLGYIGGIYDGPNGRIGAHRLAAIQRILEERGQYDPSTFHVGEISRESGYALAKKAVEEHTLAEAVLWRNTPWPRRFYWAVTRWLRAHWRPSGSWGFACRKMWRSLFIRIFRRWRASGPLALAWKCSRTMCGRTRWSCCLAESASGAPRRSPSQYRHI